MLEKDFKRFKNAVLSGGFTKVRLDRETVSVCKEDDGKFEKTSSDFGACSSLNEIVEKGTLPVYDMKLRDWLMFRFAKWVYKKYWKVEWYARRKIVVNGAVFDFSNNELCKFITKSKCIWSKKWSYAPLIYIPFWLLYDEYLLEKEKIICLNRWRERLCWGWRKKLNADYKFDEKFPIYKFVGLEVALELYFSDCDVVLLRADGNVEAFFYECGEMVKFQAPVFENVMIADYLIDEIIPFSRSSFMEALINGIRLKKVKNL